MAHDISPTTEPTCQTRDNIFNDILDYANRKSLLLRVLSDTLAPRSMESSLTCTVLHCTAKQQNSLQRQNTLVSFSFFLFKIYFGYIFTDCSVEIHLFVLPCTVLCMRHSLLVRYCSYKSIIQETIIFDISNDGPCK